MKTPLVGVVGLLVIVSGSAAYGADRSVPPTYKAPPAVVADPWNGFYVGLNGGGGVARNRTTDTTVLPIFGVFGADSFNHTPVGAVFGGQIGWNWHAAPSLVLGLEADWQWSNQKETVCVSACLPALGFVGLLSALDEQSVKSFGTVRGRIGWIAPNGALLYATGGAAWARVDETVTLVGTPDLFTVGTTSGASFSHDKTGWTVGAGVETPLWSNWSVKAEYLYVNLGSVTDSFTSALGPALGGPAVSSQTTTSSYTVRDHIFRLGVNYHPGGAADAADSAPLYYKAAPAYYKAAPAPVTRGWNGFYAGLNGGRSIGRNPTTDTTVLPGIAFPVFGGDSFSHAPVGGIFGVQLGWNWQVAPSLVVGVEADWQWSGQKDSVCVSACLPPDTLGPALLSLTDEQSVKWLGTARGRIGWVTPGGSLWYATGGAAWGRVNQTLTLAATTGFFAPGAGTTNAASFSQDRLGWTVGTGVEVPIWSNWSVKAEYLYVDLGSMTNSFTTALDPGFAPPATSQTTSSSYSIRDHIVRVGLNYRFDWGGPVIAKY
jgi:outer membrane immunogenic protein